jgi:phenylacetate-CoA ligase
MRAWNDISAFTASSRSARGSRRELLDYRDRLLRRIIHHAYEKVPYYRELFERAGVAPEDFKTAEDLARIPVTEKRHLRKEPEERVLAAGTDSKRLIVRTTTGSTGEPFTVMKSRSDEFLYHISRLRVMQDLGLQPSDRMAQIGRRSNRQAPLSWRLIQRFGFFRQDRIYLGDAPDQIADVLQKIKPDIVTGDVAVMDRVSLELAGRRHDHHLRFVVTGGGMLNTFMRKRIREGFGADVYDTYGSEEMSVIAWECRETGLYHVREDNVVAEVLENGRPAKEGERGEVVVTALHFRAMPFLRYRLGDEAVKGPDVCPCGRPFSTLKEISGRATDYLHLPDGREIFAAAVAYILHEQVAWIERYEFVQEHRDRVVLRIAALIPPRADVLTALKDKVAGLLGPGVDVRIELVPEIQPGSGGKYRVLRSLLGSPYDIKTKL